MATAFSSNPPPLACASVSVDSQATSPAACSAAEAAEPAEPAEPPRVLLQMPVDVRSVSLMVLATLASVFALRWASAVFIPVVMGLLFSYGLSPVVDWLERYRISRVFSAAVLVLSIVFGVAATAYSLSDDASKLVESLPVAVQKLRESIGTLNGRSDSTLTAVQKAVNQLEASTEPSNRDVPVGRGVQRVQVERQKFDIKDHLWSGTMGLFAMLGQLVIVTLITFFLMASGDTFRRKLIKVAGPTLHNKKITLQAINEVHDQIQRYMLVQIFTSGLVGVATWLCFLAVGMEHAAVWGIAAGVLNLVPYLGNVVVTTSSVLVGFLQFGTLDMALLVGGCSLVINSIEGFLLTPWLTSRASKMNPVAVFVGVLAWGWLWGAWGLLLGVPVLMVVKAICDRVDDFKPVGEFLGA